MERGEMMGGKRRWERRDDGRGGKDGEGREGWRR